MYNADMQALTPEALAASCVPLAIMLATRAASRAGLQGADADDLRGEAMVALMRAAKAYDPSRGAAFTTLACPYIRNGIGAALRRDGRRRERYGLADVPPAREDDAAEAASHRATVAALMLVLRKQERAVIERLYLRGETQADVASALGVGAARVRQIEAAALTRLRAALGVGRPDPAAFGSGVARHARLVGIRAAARNLGLTPATVRKYVGKTAVNAPS